MSTLTVQLPQLITEDTEVVLLHASKRLKVDEISALSTLTVQLPFSSLKILK